MHDFWRRIGGPDAISWVTAVVMPPVIYAINIAGSGVTLQTAFWPLTLSSAASIVAMFAWLFAAKYTLLRNTASTPRPMRTMLVILISLVLRAWVFDTLLQAFGATTESEFWFRLIVAIPVFGVAIPLTGYLVSLSRDYSRNSAQTRQALAELETAQATAKEMVTNYRTELQNRVRTEIEAELANILAETPDRALDQVRHTIEDVVRPLSQQLTSETQIVSEPELAAGSRTNWLDVLRNATVGNPVHPIIVSVWVSGTALFWTLLRINAPVAFAFGLVAFVMVGLTLQATRWLWNLRIHRLSSPWQALCYSFALVLGTVFTNLVATRMPILGSQYTSTTWIATAVLVLAAGWSVAVIFSLRRELARSARELTQAQNELHEQYVRINTTLRLQQVAIGRVVHGPVQDALSAAGIRLARSLGLHESVTGLLAELRRSIDASLRDLASAPKQNVVALLADLQELWDGAVEIRGDLTPDALDALERHHASAITVVEIVREACSNAIRHGNAEHIEVKIDPQPSSLQVIVQNTKKPIDAAAARGVGSTILNELCLDWSIVSTDGQTTLSARVPLV